MDKSEIIGTLLFVNSQYWICAIIARIGFVITGMSELMTPVTAVLYFGLLYLSFSLSAHSAKMMTMRTNTSTSKEP